MDMKQTAEELAAEQAAMTEAKEEEVRANIITEYGFDEVEDGERIDKLVAKEVEYSKKLSSAIGQKIKHRTEAEELRKKVATPQSKDNVLDSETLDKKFEEKFKEKMEQRELEEMDYDDEIKAEIQKLAKTQGISIKQAARDPYIAYKVGEYDKVHKTEEASISRNNKSHSRRTFSMDNPPEVDMSTEEGRKEWEAYKTAMKKQGY